MLFEVKKSSNKQFKSPLERWERILGLADIRDLSVGLLQLSGTVIGYVGVCGAVRCSLRNEETCNVEQASWLHGLRVTMAVPANYKTIAMNCARVLWVLPSPKCADIFMIPMNVCFPLRFYLGVRYVNKKKINRRGVL